MSTDTERPVFVPDDTLRNQRLAADPAASAWVEANAGSGKTYVLTERVLRLLLTGARPEAILCLTYTKAAAAEMRRRIAGRLAEWALMDDAALARVLSDAQGTAPDAEKLARARTLFAHALETPGGLKINTIHAFCEAVLHRFPLEAGVPFDFSVIEDDERAEMIRRARESVLAGGLRGHPEVAEAVALLFDRHSDSQIEAAISTALSDLRRLRTVLADPLRAKANLRRLAGLGPEETLADLIEDARAFTHVPPARHRDILAICPPDPEGKRFEDQLARLDPDAFDLDAVLGAYLTRDGVPPKNFPKAALKKADPALADLLALEAERLAQIFRRRTALALVERSEALLDVLLGIARHYEGQKRARALLDFDDLIARLADLLEAPDLGPWVRYKLDAGITHILVDESQDTNPEQWRVVQALAEEFFDGAGAGAVPGPRTLFAVGDEKQSIYSFQGAEPRLFGETGAHFGRKAKAADLTLRQIPLRTSFRTLSNILKGVDAVCADPAIHTALWSRAEPTRHETARSTEGGLIEIWPLIREVPHERPEDRWPTRSAETGQSAARGLAMRIARVIRGWIAEGRPLAGRGRAVEADDVLILVQSRGAVFKEIIRALKLMGIPSPGADRLPVSSHIAVLDLLALADILLNPDDDLTLAAVLRSPLFDLDEEALFTLAHDRKGTLSAALAESDLPAARAAHERLETLRRRRDLDRPYDFFAQVLYAMGGLERFHARLGTEVDDVIAELLDMALAHEQTDQPTLTGFVARMRASEVTIKRELAEGGGGVRVMTVHGAKGLEAPIVILADAATATPPQKLGRPVYAETDPPGPLLVFAPARSDHTERTLAFRERDSANQMAEYWRKLYVAMTRAEDELYVAGTLTATGKPEGSWYAAIEGALAPETSAHATDDFEAPILRFPRVLPPPAPVRARAMPPGDAAVPVPPGPVPPRAGRMVVTPSGAHGRAARDASLASAGEALLDADTARRRGIALHALLQHLAPMPAPDRPGVARAAIASLLPVDADLHDALMTEALALLSEPGLAALFGPCSRAEVPFALDLVREGAPVRLMGRMDRIVVEAGRVLVVDFKSDAAPPPHQALVPPAYLAQLGLYHLAAQRLFPGQAIEAGILWTATRTLMVLPAAMLAAAAGPGAADGQP